MTEETEIEWIAPDGMEIMGTTESVPAAASVRWLNAASPDYEHDGSGSEVFWNGQTTREIEGATMFLDDDGIDWLEHHLIPADFPDGHPDTGGLSPDTCAEMQREIAIGEALAKAREIEAVLGGSALRKLYVGRGAFVSIRTAVALLATDYAEAKRRAAEMKAADLAARAAGAWAEDANDDWNSPAAPAA